MSGRRVGTPGRGLRGRGRWWRRIAILLGVIGVLFLSQPAAYGQVLPINAPPGLPDNLREYIPGTPQWNTSPWMTSPTCHGRGGDWSIYTQNVLHDAAALLVALDPSYGPVAGDSAHTDFNKKIVDAVGAVANQVTVPSGYCVDDVRLWAGADFLGQPFGFQWGQADPNGTTQVYCDNYTVGADHGPCGGFYVSCQGASTPQTSSRCQAWNEFSDNYVTSVRHSIDKVIAKEPPAEGWAQTITEPMSPSQIMNKILNWTVEHGMAQVTSFVLNGAVALWQLFLQLAVHYSTAAVSGNGFADVYNLVAGVALAVAFLGWLVSLAGAWRQGRIAFTLLGGIKAAVGVTLAGVGAILMLQLSDQCTSSLAEAGGNIVGQADFTADLVKANPLIALLAGIMIAICLIFALVFLVTHGALVLMWALMGSIAAAGQVNPASSGWLLKWASRLTALAWARFAMVAVMLLAQALLGPTQPGEDPGQQVVDVLQGVALVSLLVSTPYLLWELVDFIGDRVGGAAASGGPAGVLGGRAGKATASGVKAGAQMGGAATTRAVGAMMSGAASVGQQLKTGWQQGYHGTGPARPPRQEEAGHPGASASGPGRSGQRAGTRPGGSGQPGGAPVINRGSVYAGSPPLVNLAPRSSTPASGSAATGSSGSGAGGAGPGVQRISGTLPLPPPPPPPPP